MAIWNGPPGVTSGVVYEQPKEFFLFRKLSQEEFEKRFASKGFSRPVWKVSLSYLKPGNLITVRNRSDDHRTVAWPLLENPQLVYMDESYGLGKEFVNGLVDKSVEIFLPSFKVYMFLKQEFFLGIREDIIGMQDFEHIKVIMNETSALYTTIHLLTEDKIAVVEYRITEDTIPIIGGKYRLASERDMRF